MTSHPSTFLCAALALVALAALPSQAQIPAGRMTAPNGYPKDFAIVKREGLFHVFYIEASSSGGDFNYLGHQTSPDLHHWTVEPNILVGDRADWNPDNVWAPSIVERDGTYWMFYTGVRRRPAESCPGAPFQQIGVATSTDLTGWTLERESWLDPLEVPWALQPQDSCTYPTFGAFRDPYVVWDPATHQWVMLYVTVPSVDSTAGNVPQHGPYDPSRYVVGLARAPLAFASDSDWVNLGALWITNQAYPSGGGMKTWESPHAFMRIWQGQPLWFLFASTGPSTGVQNVSFMTGPELTLSRFEKKGRSGWTWRGPISNLQIRDQYGNSNQPTGWFATEYFRDPETGLEYFANVNIPHLEFRQLKWRSSSYGFDLEQPFAFKELEPQPTSVYAGQPISMTLRSVNAQDGAGAKVARFEVLNVGADGESLGVALPSSVGLPDSVTITNDLTQVTWNPVLQEGELMRRYLVRLAPPWNSVASPVITVWSGRPRVERPGDSGGMGAGAKAVVRDALFLGVQDSPGPRPMLAFHLHERSATRLELYDLRGRRVRRLTDRELPAGSYDVAWDARDDDGRHVPSGIYFAYLEAAGERRKTRVVLLHR